MRLLYPQIEVARVQCALILPRLVSRGDDAVSAVFLINSKSCTDFNPSRSIQCEREAINAAFKLRRGFRFSVDCGKKELCASKSLTIDIKRTR